MWLNAYIEMLLKLWSQRDESRIIYSYKGKDQYTSWSINASWERKREQVEEGSKEIHKRRRADTKELDGNVQRRRLAIFAKLSELNRIMSSRWRQPCNSLNWREMQLSPSLSIFITFSLSVSSLTHLSL